jgi:hypothetical protein
MFAITKRSGTRLILELSDHATEVVELHPVNLNKAGLVEQSREEEVATKNSVLIHMARPGNPALLSLELQYPSAMPK